VDSEPFAVGPVAIAPGAVSVSDGVASVRPLYPDPGEGSLLDAVGFRTLPWALVGRTADCAARG